MVLLLFWSSSRTCRKRWEASWDTCQRRAAHWQGLCAPAPGRRRWTSGSWWCRGRTAADCCWSVCAAWTCSEPRWGPTGPLQRKDGDRGEDQRGKVRGEQWWEQKQTRGEAEEGDKSKREKKEKNRVSEPLRHLCWIFKTQCGGLENWLFTKASNVQKGILKWIKIRCQVRWKDSNKHKSQLQQPSTHTFIQRESHKLKHLLITNTFSSCWPVLTSCCVTHQRWLDTCLLFNETSSC